MGVVLVIMRLFGPRFLGVLVATCLCVATSAVPALAQTSHTKDLSEAGPRILVDPKPQDRTVATPEAPSTTTSGATSGATSGSIRTPAAPVPYSARSVTPPASATVAQKLPQAGERALSVDMIDEAAKPLPVAAQATVTPLPPTGEGAYEERVELARQLLEIDGTEAIIRHFVGEVHMRLIIGEVSKYIDINGLNESDRYRLATIVATATTELGDKILLLTARNHAQNLSREDLVYLAHVNDTDAQRKLTQMRIDDTGELDKNAELIMQIAALKIVQIFEQP